jgi:hypothetical protein
MVSRSHDGLVTWAPDVPIELKNMTLQYFRSCFFPIASVHSNHFCFVLVFYILWFLMAVMSIIPLFPFSHHYVHLIFVWFRERNEDSLQRKKGDGLFQTIGKVHQKKKDRRGHAGADASFSDLDIGTDFDDVSHDDENRDNHDHQHADFASVSDDHFHFGHVDFGNSGGSAFEHSDASDFGAPGDAFEGYA